MPIKIVRNDITKMECDAIVNAANSTLLGGGGVDGAIHKAAGRGLLLECMKLGGCKVGQAKLTKAYQLPSKFVIHTVGPIWRGGGDGEKELLESCYRESLKIAVEHHCESVAFPLISSGIYGYPKAQALRVAVDTIVSFLTNHDMLVYIVVFDRSSFRISEKLFTDITSYIDDKYTDTNFIFRRTRQNESGESTILAETQLLTDEMQTSETRSRVCPTMAAHREMPLGELSLEDAVSRLDESFTQMLLRKIDEKGMTDVECYKKANIDRKLFSKIRGDVHYRPGKTTVIAFAIALELSLEDTKEMLMKAGFALSHSNKFDIIIEYFIVNENYNIFEINEALFAFDQSLLGA